MSAQAKASSVATTVVVTNTTLKLWGVCTVVGSSLLSLLFALGVRNTLSRKQLQAPAADLRDRFETTKQAITVLQVPDSNVPQTLAAIEVWLAGLSDKALQKAGFIPPWWAVNPTGQTSTLAYQQLLDRAGAWATALLHVQSVGLTPLKAWRAQYADTANATQVDQILTIARQSLDGLVPQPFDTNISAPVLIDQAIGAALLTAKTAIETQTQAPMAPPMGGAPVASDGDRVRYQIMMLSLANVLVAIVVTGLVGSYVMVISHPDFGRLGDFAMCVLWGFGLPVTTSQLASATPSGLATTLGVTLPKTT